MANEESCDDEISTSLLPSHTDKENEIYVVVKPITSMTHKILTLTSGLLLILIVRHLQETNIFLITRHKNEIYYSIIKKVKFILQVRDPNEKSFAMGLMKFSMITDNNNQQWFHIYIKPKINLNLISPN
uniref:CSON005843 protein n=1 Tax=Culicoides sonorensis TaxID=179676 RepID=A0A336LVD9_CULSO